MAVGMIIAYLIFISIVMWIWNRTMTSVFGIPQITFWQTFGILILSNILFGSHNVMSYIVA